MLNKVTKAFIKIGFWTFISRIFGFFRDVLLAAALGAGFLSDVFFIANYNFPDEIHNRF